jgi:CBS-domain-containing membrane protein
MKRSAACVSKDDLVVTAAAKMRDENVGFLPVCDENKKVQGTITDRDIAIRVCAESRPQDTTRVGDVMTREVVSCRQSDDLGKARQLMAEKRKSRIVCLDENDCLAGVISLADIAQDDDDAGGRALRDITSRESAHL